MKMFCHFSILDFIFTPDCVIRNFFCMLYNFICTEPVTMKMLSTKSMRESISTRTTSKLITTLMTTKRSLTSPRPIKRESTQMRFNKMGMTDKTTPSSRRHSMNCICILRTEISFNDFPTFNFIFIFKPRKES